ncbi:hypothetical protein QTI51_28805 [Variovorax sp. J22G73]|uniref:hypothetical protein n=1 Tax=unclassified Variovorax TaxID=663243 RepID=UPI002575F070|nr:MULTISPECIES: hypothetical protein [unclassified Variovorax]MDM0008853.1 hypothetical protein [Variovorax sp. J22R203]MDM0101311.1 hypothetical protein [Variovorax sp. J22G73]
MTKVVPSPYWAIAKIAASALFDVDYYLTKYPDVALAKLDPYEHYCSYGWKEGRDPSSDFSTKFYLQANPDVAASKINPLEHYAANGIKEGRAAFPPHSAESGKSVVLAARPARVRALDWLPVVDINSPLDREALRLLLASAFEKNPAEVGVSMSHDQYTKSVGGVQTSISIEQEALTSAGWTYVHLCPALPLPFLADPVSEDATFFVLTLNGRREGVVRLSDLLAVIPPAASEQAKSIHLIVHHLMGLAVDAVLRVSKICNGGPPIVWVHDFFSLCTNPFLLRNDRTFCNAPSESSSACLVCCEGAGRGAHLESMRRFFDQLCPVVLAPSSTAMNFWKIKGGFTYSKAIVIPLAQVELGVLESGREKRPLRVAHLGAAAPHKGWATFVKLIERHGRDERYEFFRLGYGTSMLDGLTEVVVEVGPGKVDAMINAVREHEIDVVINWSNCFETFSFITLEALAAGAFVVARRDAGNVWPAVVAADSSRGIAISTEIELRALFATGKVAELASAAMTRGKLHRSRGTADFLLKKELSLV